MEAEQDGYSSSKRNKFRFKSKSSSKERDRDTRARSRSASPDNRERARSHRHRHHRHHHHRRHKRKKSPESCSRRDEHVEPQLSPNVAFRESLFDALADDEGAQYWEGVYGQPMHTYDRPDGRGGLEIMTDDEYATYVRAKMWEKTHEGLLEERERRRRARERKDEERRREGKAGSEREAFERMIDESLRRGQERRTKKRRVNDWKKVWERYLESWEELNRLAREAALSSNTPEEHGTSSDWIPRLRNLIVWPVESGKKRDVTPEAVRKFIENAPSPPSIPGSGQQTPLTPSVPSDFLATLKAERVRWHPDKIQHRYGMLGIEDQMVKSVTEVFQIMDRMWVEEREKQ